jgi:hypothetical protein
MLSYIKIFLCFIFLASLSSLIAGIVINNNICIIVGIIGLIASVLIIILKTINDKTKISRKSFYVTTQKRFNISLSEQNIQPNIIMNPQFKN